MLGGWYCRTLANEQAQQDEPTDPNVDVNEEDSGTDDSQDQGQQGNKSVDYKLQYRYMKRKLKFLIYENEFFQDALRSNQRRLLKVSRDRAFLLDRLLQYEKPENTSSESDETESSEDEAAREAKKRKMEQNTNGTTNNGGGSTRGRKKKVAPTAAAPLTESSVHSNEFHVAAPEQVEQHQGHMTAAEVERHLQSRQPVMELMPERAPATVPTEMFSNEPSLDSESNDHIIDGSSPTHVAAEECVPMEYSN